MTAGCHYRTHQSLICGSSCNRIRTVVNRPAMHQSPCHSHLCIGFISCTPIWCAQDNLLLQSSIILLCPAGHGFLPLRLDSSCRRFCPSQLQLSFPGTYTPPAHHWLPCTRNVLTHSLQSMVVATCGLTDSPCQPCSMCLCLLFLASCKHHQMAGQHSRTAQLNAVKWIEM